MDVKKLFTPTPEQKQYEREVTTEGASKASLEELPVAKTIDKITMTQAQNPPRHPLSQRFHDILKEVGELHDKKQKDYGSPEDPLANLRSAGRFAVPPYLKAFLEMDSCMQKLDSLYRNKRLENDSVDNVLKDLAVFSIIALVLWEEDQTTNGAEEV